MSLLDFFTQEAGQRRRSALDELGREIGTYVPPELRGILGLIAESTPTASIDRASQSAVRMVEPGRTVGQRFGDLGGLLSETAGVVAPALVGPRAGMTATQALEEMFMMPAAGVDDVARQFASDESGALRLTRGHYIGGHSAPPIEPGATLDNPTTMFGGDDIYTRNAMQYFGTGDPRMDQQSLSVIQKMRNSPDADVTIYRAVPTGAPDEIGAGDWVTLSPEYAKLHGESVLDGDYRVVKEKVKASELATEGNSIHEWGWWPAESRLNQLAPLPAPRNEVMADDAARRFVMDESGSIGASSPFANMTRETFLGNPRITGPSNAASLKPKALRGLEDAEKIDFPVGKLTARYDDSGAAVYDGDKVIASYNFGDTLVVDPKYRKQGIGEELVYQWRTRFPAPAATKTRTKVSQRIQENVWDRIQRELAQSTPTTRPATPLEEAHPGGLLTLPAPRNEAEAAAREVLEMRAAGRAGDVTDELMAQADPQYMFANTPLPMDETSRMARAGELEAYHGTTASFPAFDNRAYAASGFGTHMGAKEAADSILKAKRSPYSPADAPAYIEGAQVLPLRVDAGPMLRVNDTETWSPGATQFAMAWSDDPSAVAAYNRLQANPDYPKFGSDVEQAAFMQNALEQEGVGGFVYDNAFEGGGDSYAVFNPANVRSRFARFDPEFRHLRNLSAGVGGLGLLATQSPEQQREEELRQYLGGLL